MDAEFLNELFTDDGTTEVVFMGENEHSIDGKGRLIVPAQFRKDLGPKFAVTRGFDKCLYVYTEAKFLQIAKKFKQQPMMNADRRNFLRNFFAAAEWCEIDKQGRILIPAKLREYAGITKDVVSVGVLERIEIWDKTNYEIVSGQQMDMEIIANQVEEMGISM